MPIIKDKEFGDITVRRSAVTHRVSVKVTPDGNLRASMPAYAPLFLVRRLIDSSRLELRKLLGNHTTAYEEGMLLGRAHTLVVEKTNPSKTVVTRKQRMLIVKLSDKDVLEMAHVQHLIREEYKKILRLEAKAYLPRRLMSLAKACGFRYSKVRYSHASGRWGSCSSSGTISLNIALMKLPHELIDYVLIHELCHTKEMNHSQAFWQLVEAYSPHYKSLRRELKNHQPHI